MNAGKCCFVASAAAAVINAAITSDATTIIDTSTNTANTGTTGIDTAVMQQNFRAEGGGLVCHLACDLRAGGVIEALISQHGKTHAVLKRTPETADKMPAVADDGGNQVVVGQTQRVDDDAACGRKIGGAQRARRHPARIAAHIAVKRTHREHIEMQAAVAVIPVEANQRAGVARCQAGFLRQFARNGLRGGLARLDLAARKLAQTALVHTARTPRHQHRITAPDNGDCNRNQTGIRQVIRARCVWLLLQPLSKQDGIV